MSKRLVAAIFLGGFLSASPALASPYIYLPDSNFATLTVVDAASNTVVRKLSNITQYPYVSAEYSVAVSHDGSRIYIDEPLDGQVGILDASKIANPNLDPVIGSISGLGVPDALAISPDDNFLFVGQENQKALEIDLATEAVKKKFNPVNLNIDTLALDRSGRLLAVASSGTNGAAVRLYTLATGAFKDISLPEGAEELAFSSDGAKLWIVTVNGQLLAYTLATGKVTTLAASGSAGAMAYSARQQALYVVSPNFTSVSVYPESGGAPSTIPLNVYPTGIALSPDGTRAYVTYYDGVAVIDTSTGQLIKHIASGSTQRLVLRDFVGPGDIRAAGTVVSSPVGQQISGTVTASDSLSRPLSYDVIEQPAAGTLNFDQSTGAYTYTPPAGSSGVESFVWEAKASTGAGSPTVPASDPITSTLVIHPVMSPFSAEKADAGATVGPIDFTLQGSVPLQITVASGNNQVIDPAGARLSSGCGTSSMSCTLTLKAGTAKGQSTKVTLTATGPSGASTTQSFTVSINGGGGGGGSLSWPLIALLILLTPAVLLNRRRYASVAGQ